MYLDVFRPVDSSLLGSVRMGFGLLMFLDCFVERGLHVADQKWSNQGCRFPLFNALDPLSYEYMVLLQFIQGIGALCFTIGFRTKKTGWLFVIPYWYMFLLDKTHWNNHSYLFGLMGIIFTLIESDASFSVSGDGKHIPMWNYYIIRLQIFILYFYAGLKKTEADWLYGYSMGKLSRKWVFDPFRYILTDSQIDLFVVHIGGFIIDFSSGPFLLFDNTRPVAFMMLTPFHVMNAQMFSIGMFPYACLLTMFIFCHPDTPRRFFTNIARTDSKQTYGPNIGFFVIMLLGGIQLFLPYSHFITKGYNGWTQGAYGYSWDMMIHSFREQHVKISYIDAETGEVGYLKPNAFLGHSRNRWTMHPDMLKQYATCLYQNLEKHGVKKPKIYFDVWKSMNSRFLQRVYDPRIDIAAYEWKWNEKPKYTMELLNDLADWRGKLQSLKNEIENEDIDVSFVADYPGLSLENYLAPDLDNTTIELMGGQVKVTYDDQEGKELHLEVGKPVKLPPGEFHTVHAIGDNAVMYMYMYQNSTDIAYRKKYKALMEIDQYLDKNKTLPLNLTDYFTPDEERQLRNYFFGKTPTEKLKVSRLESVIRFKQSYKGRLFHWMDTKLYNFRRGVLLVYFAMSDIVADTIVSKDIDELDYYERLTYLNEWSSPFKTYILQTIDSLAKTAKIKLAGEQNLEKTHPESDNIPAKSEGKTEL